MDRSWTRILHLSFSRTGKFLNRIGSIGQGPGEYVNYLTFLVDEDKKEVYIFSTNNGVLVYDFEGGFKSKFQISKLWLECFRLYISNIS